MKKKTVLKKWRSLFKKTLRLKLFLGKCRTQIQNGILDSSLNLFPPAKHFPLRLPANRHYTLTKDSHFPHRTGPQSPERKIDGGGGTNWMLQVRSTWSLVPRLPFVVFLRSIKP